MCVFAIKEIKQKKKSSMALSSIKLTTTNLVINVLEMYFKYCWNSEQLSAVLL